MAAPGRTALLLFFLVFCSYLITSTGRVHVPDEASAFFQARNLVETGQLVVPEATPGFEFYGRRDLAGRPRAPYGPAHALAIIPFYLVGKALTRAPGVPAEAADLVMTFGAVLSSAAFSALAVALFFRLLERRAFSTRAALGASVALAAATPIFAYSAYLYSEPLAAALLVAAALALFGSETPLSVARGVAAGALFGIAILVRPAHALAVPLVATVLVFDRKRAASGGLLALAGTVAAAIALYLWWNHHLYGDVLEFGYPKVADGKMVNTFSTPILRGIAGFTVSPGKSLFLFAPVAVPALAGLARLSKRDPGLALFALVLPLGYLLFYSRFSEWEGGYSFGPRYLVPIIPILLVGLGPIMEFPGRRRAVAWLIGLGMLVQAIGLATSFLEDQRRGTYYDESFTYRLSYSPLASQGELLMEYTAAALAGRPAAPLGKGFDRWWIFLRKAGVAPATLAVWVLACVIAAVATAAIALKRAGGHIVGDST